MAKVLQHKVVSALPSPLEANSIYFVRVGTGFDIYVTNSSGTIVAYPINREPVIATGTVDQFYRGDKTWQDLATAVRAASLTGLSTSNSSAVVATDTVLVGVGKLQAQVSGLSTTVGGKEPAITGGTAAQYWRGDKSWRDFFTDVRAATLTGLSTATATAISAADTVLLGLGKLQAQINAANTAISNKEPTITSGTTAQFWRGDKSWTDLATTVRASVLTGLSVAVTTAVVATDTVLQGIGKLQGQIDSLTTTVNGKEPAIASGTTAQVWRGDKTWIDLGPAVRATSLAGLNITNSAIVAADSLLIAGGKTQGQINAINTTLSGKANSGSNSDITNLNTLASATWSGTGGRIYADMSHATQSNRLMLQSTTTNGASIPGIIPNGTSQVAGLQVYNAADPNNAGLGQVAITSTAMQVLAGSNGTGTNLPIDIYVGGARRARFDTGGSVFVGDLTSSAGIALGTGAAAGSLASAGYYASQAASSAINIQLSKVSGFSQNAFHSFAVNGSIIGSITTTGSATAYNTTSDYRLKDKVDNASADQAWERLSRYRIVTFAYKADPDTMIPFGGIAHELAEVNPDMVTGEKDAIYEYGSIYEMRPVGTLYDQSGEVLAEGIQEPTEHSGYWQFTGAAEFEMARDMLAPEDMLPGVRWEKTSEVVRPQGVDWSKAVPELILNLQTAKAMILELQQELAELRQAISA